MRIGEVENWRWNAIFPAAVAVVVVAAFGNDEGVRNVGWNLVVIVCGCLRVWIVGLWAIARKVRMKVNILFFSMSYYPVDNWTGVRILAAK